MRPQLAAAARRAGGVVTRKQARESGYTETELRGLLDRGEWVAVRRGVYAEQATVEATDALVLADRAAHVSTNVWHVLSHDSAARAHGIPMLRVDPQLAHLTRHGIWGSRVENGIKQHLTRFDLPETRQAGGLRVTTPERTALDLAREHGHVAGVIALDHVLHHGGDRQLVEAELARMWCWPFVTRAKAALADVDPRAESIAETLGRLLLTELGIGAVDAQFPVRTAIGTFWCDLRVGNHLFEVDGEVKYVPVSAGGLARADASEVVRRERERQREICARDLGMSRIVWADFFGAARRRAIQRLEHEYDVTRRRFGDELAPHLAAEAAEIRARRPRLAG